MGNQGFGEFVAEAEVTSDAVSVEVVVVNACGHDGDPPQRFCESDRDTTRNRFLLVRRDGQHRAGGRPQRVSALGGIWLREHHAADVGPIPTTNRHNHVVANSLGPRLEISTARGIFHPADQAFHVTSRTRV